MFDRGRRQLGGANYLLFLSSYLLSSWCKRTIDTPSWVLACSLLTVSTLLSYYYYAINVSPKMLLLQLNRLWRATQGCCWKNTLPAFAHTTICDVPLKGGTGKTHCLRLHTCTRVSQFVTCHSRVALERQMTLNMARTFVLQTLRTTASNWTNAI